MGLFDDIREQYEGFAESMRENGIPIPSLEVTIAGVLVLLLGAYILIAQPFAPKTMAFQVKVITGSNSTPVGNASVSISDLEENSIADGLTDNDGIALFENIPKKGISVFVSKKGVGNATKTLQTTPDKITIPIGAGATASNKTVQIKLRVLDESTAAALEGATVTYTFSDDPAKKFTATGGKDGLAVLDVPADRAMNLIIFRADYDEEKFSLPAKNKKGEYQVKLRRSTGGPTASYQATFEFGTLRVSVKSQQGDSLDADVHLFSAQADEEMASVTASSGKASFPNLMTGSKFYVKVFMEGYSDYDGRLNPAEIGKNNEIQVTMRKGILVAGKLKVFTIDEDGNEIPAKVQLLAGDGMVSEKQSTGETTLDLAQLSALDGFRLAAFASGMLPAISETYSANSIPEEVTLVLASATYENSAILAISTKGKAGGQLGSVAVRVYSEAEGLIAAATSDSYGSAEFTLGKDAGYALIGEYGREKGSASLVLSEDKSVPLFIGAAVEQMKVGARNALTEEPVDATFYVLYDDATFDSCFGSSCDVFAKSLLQTTLKVTADGYFDKNTIIVPSGDGSEKIVDMVPEDLHETYVKFLGIFDSIGREAKEAMPGEPYYAKILLAAPSAEKLGAYFRVGKEGKAGDDIVHIDGYAAIPSATAMSKATTFSATSDCNDENSGSGQYKWMNLEFAQAAEQEVMFKFTLAAKAERDTELPFYYRGYAVKNSEYFRMPADTALGTQESTTAVNWCHARTFEGSLKIKKKGTYSCSTLGCLSITLEQDGLEGVRDFQARSAENCESKEGSPNSCLNSMMKIKINFAPNDKSKEFDLLIKEDSARVKLESYSVNSEPAKTISLTSLATPLYGAGEYVVIIGSLPRAVGIERINAKVTEAVGDLELKKSVSMKIYSSCENGLKDCGGGQCELICIGDYYADQNDPQEETPEEPACEDGMSYCNDGECRDSCVIEAGTDFTSEGEITLRNGKLDGPASIKMQIDQVVPVDAVPLKFTNIGGSCEPLYEIISPKNKACYAVDGGNLIFRGNEISSACPLESVGDNAEGDASAKLKVVCSGVDPIEIPIKVAFKKINIKAVQFQPRSVTGSASKLFHVLNQKQVPAKYAMEDVNLDFSYADAYSYAWSGAGVLQLRKGDEAVDQISYERSETYFPEIDNQGGRTNGCSDYGCCASQWCTPEAAQQAFLKFKDAAKQVADATIFRRQNNFIQSEVLKRPFTFATVMRLVEKADLPSGINAEDAPSSYGCKDENPKIYIVQASTPDGKSWKYTARIARLYKFAYLTPEEQCASNGMLPEMKATDTHGYSSPGDYLPLCNYLRGKGSCVQNEPESSLASQEQVATKRQLFPIPVPSLFVTAILKGIQCHTSVEAQVVAEFEGCVQACCAEYCPPQMVCPGPCRESCPAECESGSDPVCYSQCNAMTSPYCTVGSSPVNYDIPAVIPFPRMTSLQCLPVNPGTPIVPICKPLCGPKASYVHNFPFSNQLYGVIHIGITKGCIPDVIGTTVVTGAYYATYKYPEQAVYVNALAQGVSSLVVGDFNTCQLLWTMALAKPGDYKLMGLAASCSVFTEMKSLKSPSGGKAEDATKGQVPKTDWGNYEFEFPDASQAAAPANALNEMGATCIVTESKPTCTLTESKPLSIVREAP
ncbi:MAG: carboxypeptidase-like regulatory domain-containing protein [Candidatus Micrarchaeota archaeon]